MIDLAMGAVKDLGLEILENFNNQPNFNIAINGMPSIVLNEHINNIVLTENRGFEADTLQLGINDPGGLIALPDRNAKITIAIGFGLDLVEKGTFIVDSITHSGPPDVITIGAHSADFKREFLERRSILFENKTVSEIVQAIADKHQFKYKVSKSLANIPIKAKSQADESDANLLTRMAEEHDAIAAIKNGTLLFLERGVGKTASGERLDTVIHKRSDGDQHQYTIADRDHYTGVEVGYLLVHESTKTLVVVGERDRLFQIRKVYSDYEEARAAAEKKYQSLQRNKASVTVNLARGNARLSAESPLKLSGFKAEMDAVDWIITTITHTMNASNGFVSQLNAEVIAG